MLGLTKSSSKPSHHADSFRTAFKNPWPSADNPTWSETLQNTFPLGLFDANLSSNCYARKLKLIQPDWGAATLSAQGLEGSKNECIIGTWLGHAGALVEMPIHTKDDSVKVKRNSAYLLFDPIFADRAGPAQYVGPSRLIKSPCQARELPGCDAVFISHNHYDHLDLPTVKAVMERFPNARWFVPLGNQAWLLETGMTQDKITEMDWWDDWEGTLANNGHTSTIEPQPRDVSGHSTAFRISCVPAQHNSGRAGWDANTSLWSGWVVERFITTLTADQSPVMLRRGTIYHAGDTGYRRATSSPITCPIFPDIGKRFGPIDLSFIPIWRGGTLGFFSYLGVKLSHEGIPSANHCSPKDAVAIHLDVQSRNTVGVHFGTFVGSENESLEAIIELSEACADREVQNLDTAAKERAEHGRFGTLDIGASLAVRIR